MSNILLQQEILEVTPNVGENIRQLCKEKGITHRELANLAGINFNTCHHYIYGHYKININSLQAIAKALNVSPEQILLKSQVRSNISLQEEILAIVPNVGENIRQLCKEKGITYRKIANLAGINFHTFKHYIYETNRINIYSLIAIAKALNVSPEQILLKNIDISKNVKIFLKLKGMSQQDLADSSTVSPYCINSLISCKHYTRAYNLKRIADGFGISLKDFLLGISPEKEKLLFDNYNIGQNIRKLLELKNLTPYKLARKTCVSKYIIDNIINGKPSHAYTLKCIANVLGISLEELIFGTFKEEDISLAG